MRLAVTSAGLSGMAAFAGPATLSPSDIYSTAVGAGFPPDVARQMTEIALHESAGQPGAKNISSREASYGLWQINVQANPWVMTQLGLSDPSQLLDPATNAKAAALLWAGNPQNLNVAWRVNSPGYEQEVQARVAPSVYQDYLSIAQGSAVPLDIGGSTAETPVYDMGVSPPVEVNWLLVGVVAGAALLGAAFIGSR